jgi:hypothetical protein
MPQLLSNKQTKKKQTQKNLDAMQTVERHSDHLSAKKTT